MVHDVKQSFVVALLCLPACGVASACARAAAPPPSLVPLPHTETPPPVALPPPPTPLPPASPPPEVARLKVPPWLTLEAVYGTSHDILHRGLTDAAFSSDGRSLVTLAYDGGLRVWDLVARTLRAEVDACAVKSPPDPFWPRAQKLALSRDGLAAVGFLRGRLCVLELEADRLVRNIDAHDANIVTLAFTNDALFSYGYQEEVVEEAKTRPIVTQREAGGQARWWNARTGAQLGELVVGPQEAVALSSDGAWLATGRSRFDWRAGKSGKSVGLWRREGRARPPVPDFAEHVAVTRTGDVLYASQDEGLRVWSEETGVFVKRFEPANHGPSDRTRALAMSDDGRFAATLAGENETLMLWDVRARREINERAIGAGPGPGRGAARLTFSADGSMIATSNSSDVAVWATRGLAPVVPVERGALADGTLQPDGRHILTVRNETASLLDITTGQRLWQVELWRGVAQLMPDGKHLLETDYDHSTMRDVPTGRKLWTVSHAGTGAARRLLVSPDGTRIAFNDDDTGGPRMHDAVNGRVLWRGGLADMLAFSADGRTLYVETRDWHLLGLATADGTVETDIDRKHTSTRSLFLSGDGKRAIVANFPNTGGYDLTTGKRLWEVKGAESRLFFLPDNQTFISDSTNLRLRSMATGLDIAPPFDPHPLDVGLRPLLLPDGKTLLLSTAEGLILRFHVAR